MVDRWTRKGRLRRQLKQINGEYIPKLREAQRSNNTNDYVRLKIEYEPQIGNIRAELETPKTARKVKTARAFGIEPSDFESYSYWEQIAGTDVHVLTKHGFADLNRRISDARLNYWKRWVEIVSPIVTVLISLFALAVSSN